MRSCFIMEFQESAWNFGRRYSSRDENGLWTTMNVLVVVRTSKMSAENKSIYLTETEYASRVTMFANPL